MGSKGAWHGLVGAGVGAHDVSECGTIGAGDDKSEAKPKMKPGVSWPENGGQKSASWKDS